MGWFSSFNKQKEHTRFWEKVSEEGRFEEILAESNSGVVILFKHSPRCGISAMVKRQFEESYPSHLPKPYLIDVVNSRPLSRNIADSLNVVHESPQLLVLKNEKVVLHKSHSAINTDELLSF